MIFVGGHHRSPCKTVYEGSTILYDPHPSHCFQLAVCMENAFPIIAGHTEGITSFATFNNYETSNFALLPFSSHFLFFIFLLFLVFVNMGPYGRKKVPKGIFSETTNQIHSAKFMYF